MAEQMRTTKVWRATMLARPPEPERPGVIVGGTISTITLYFVGDERPTEADVLARVQAGRATVELRKIEEMFVAHVCGSGASG